MFTSAITSAGDMPVDDLFLAVNCAFCWAIKIACSDQKYSLGMGWRDSEPSSLWPALQGRRPILKVRLSLEARLTRGLHLNRLRLGLCGLGVVRLDMARLDHAVEVPGELDQGRLRETCVHDLVVVERPLRVLLGHARDRVLP